MKVPVRHRRGEDRERRFPPLPATHPAVGADCGACGGLIADGAVTAAVVLGPGSDRQEQTRAARGEPYTAEAVLCHADCVNGWDPEEAKL